MRRSPQLVRVMLLAYVGLLVQPCAMAMVHTPGEHYDNCHHEAQHHDHETCMSQPALDCAAGDSIVDARESSFEISDTQLVAIIPVISDPVASGSDAALRYYGRAPPCAGPALNVRLCVFLK